MKTRSSVTLLQLGEAAIGAWLCLAPDNRLHLAAVGAAQPLIMWSLHFRCKAVREVEGTAACSRRAHEGRLELAFVTG
jgi:hypothetical protein